MFGISAIVFTGCTKDEEENTNASDLKLVGTWTFDDTDIEVEIDDQDAKAWLVAHGYSEEDASEEVFFMKMDLSDDFLPEGATFEFKDDNKFAYKIFPGGEGEEGTWEFNADKTEIIIKGVGQQGSNRRISTNIEEKGESETITFGVESMTKTLMVISNTIEDSHDFNDDETDETYKIISKYEFTK